MSRFLFTTWPFPGHLIPHITIAEALQQRGHECAFYTGMRGASLLQAHQIGHFPFRALDEDALWALLFEQQAAFIHWTRHREFQELMRKWLLETIPAQVSDLETVIDEWKPDAIVTDPTVWGPILVMHEKRRIPVAVSCYFACKIPGPDVPPFGLGLPLPRRMWQRASYPLLGWIVDRAAAGFRRKANDIRASFGLPALSKSVSAYAGEMPLYMVPTSAEFDYNRKNLPSSVHYVGPCLKAEKHDATSSVLANLSTERPWIHVTEGTIHVQEPLVLRAAAQGLADLPVEVIMSTGGNREPSEIDLGVVASNVHLFRWVSHSELLPKTAVLVTTGGAGSVMASLRAGVPMVVVPTEWDKPEVAQRVVESGAGLRLAPKNCTPERLRDAVQSVLHDKSFRENARRLQASFERYRGPDQAADLLTELVQQNANRSVVAHRY